jgi:hypothetical protein
MDDCSPERMAEARSQCMARRMRAPAWGPACVLAPSAPRERSASSRRNNPQSLADNHPSWRQPHARGPRPDTRTRGGSPSRVHSTEWCARICRASDMGTLEGFPCPPAMVRGEQSSPAPHATTPRPSRDLPARRCPVSSAPSWRSISIAGSCNEASPWSHARTVPSGGWSRSVVARDRFARGASG